MRIEHLALNVPAAEAMADWYVANLGLRIVRRGASNQMRFLADDGGGTVLELYTNPDAPIPDYAALHPMTLHLAFGAADVAAVRQRLLDAGASPAVDLARTAAGDVLAIVRDPWGVPVQLVARGTALPR